MNASGWNPLQNCAWFASEAWQVGTGEYIDPSNGKTVGDIVAEEHMKGFAMRLISIFLFFVVAIAEGGDIVSNVNKESDLHMRSIFISDGSKKVTGPRKGEKARLRAR